MTNFIEVTIKSGLKILINKDQIQYIIPHKEEAKGTILYLSIKDKPVLYCTNPYDWFSAVLSN